MRIILSVIVFLAGICVTVYLGIFVLAVDCIEHIVSGANASPADGARIAWGVIGTVMSIVVIVIGVRISAFFGLLVIGDGDNSQSRLYKTADERSNREIERDWERRSHNL